MAADRPTGLRFALRDWLRLPRAHGETIPGRVAGPLELFYDLVFVVFVSQVAQALAAHPDAAGLRDFVVLFALVWYTWLNGSMYQNLHGSDDGRSRVYMFVQMSLIALMSVYVANASQGDADGRAFAVLLLLLIGWLTYQWWVVRRQDEPAMAAATTSYFIGLGGIFLFVAVSIGAPAGGARVLLWGLGSLIAIVTPVIGFSGRAEQIERAFQITSSMAERFSLFTIIVLGQVIVGIVNGLGQANRSMATTAVGLMCLGICFGIWWNYFDFVGMRQPRAGLGVRGAWLLTHLPLSMAVAATGAGMVSLIDHSGGDHTPVATAWLIGGSVAILCGCLALLVRLLPERTGARLVPAGLIAAAVLALAAAGLDPPPWALALILVVVLAAVWIESFARHARLGEPFVDATLHEP